MKVIYPKKEVIKSIEIPNFLLFNRFLFGLLKIFLCRKHFLFFKLKYKHIKSIVKVAKNYKGFEIVNIVSRQGDNVKILL